jgi:hypothetical protein
MVIWDILRQFGIFSPVLFYEINKNLATLNADLQFFALIRCSLLKS